MSFSFGENWTRFVARLDESQIAYAQANLLGFTRLSGLGGHTFLDIGCGSGVGSLVAWRLGASRVVSVDIDGRCVECTESLRGRFAGNPPEWRVLRGSALDNAFLASLGRFSFVYSWGVLHHTGAMWQGIENLSHCVLPGGQLHLALYNEHRRAAAWLRVKRLCNRWPRTVLPALKASYVLLAYARLLSRFESPVRFTRQYREQRGMDFRHDVEDWLGGLPYEYCRPEQPIDFLLQRGFTLARLRTSDSLGCNEFLFTAPGAAA